MRWRLFHVETAAILLSTAFSNSTLKHIFFTVSLLWAGAVQAQTLPIDPTAPVRGGEQGQTAVPPVNPALNQSTIQGPAEVQRTITSRDAQPSQPSPGAVLSSTPESSPTVVPDVREQPLIKTRPRRESTDIVPSRDRRSRSNKTPY